MNPFIKPLSEYQRDIDHTREYVRQMTKLAMLLGGMNEGEAKKFIRMQVKTKGPVDPIVRYTLRNENQDVSIEETTLSNYINDSIQHDDILVPSFTAYTHPKIEQSLHAEYMFTNIKLRSSDKKKAFYHEMRKEMDLYNRYDTFQKTRKIKNNGMSGAYASKSTILWNPSAHYTLTSMTRTATSIANAVTEHMSIGNRFYHSEDVVINHLMATITSLDYKEVKRIVDKYNIAIPTVDHLYAMVMRSTNLYWENDEFNYLLLGLLRKLDDIEKCMFMYTNDLFHLGHYNKDLVKGILGEMSTKVNAPIENHEELMKDIPFFVTTHTHGVCRDEIRGKVINYKNMDDIRKLGLLDLLVGTSKHAYDTILKYSDLFNVFFRSIVMPPSIAKIRTMIRRVTVLSDTDSTCASYGHWVKFYKDEVGFSSEDIAISSAAMTIVTQVIEHHLRQYSTNMNIPNDIKEVITYKGEFFWTSMTPMEVSKHYYASVAIKEGNVFEKEKLELKGVNLIASTTARDLQDLHKDIIKKINHTTAIGESIDLNLYIKQVALLEKTIIDAINEGNIDIFKKAKIKDPSGYKASENESNYIHHKLWREVFEDKYGVIDEPPYTTIKVPVTTDTANKMKTFVSGISDPDIRERFKAFQVRYGKDYMATFYLPVLALMSSGIPEELKPIMNINKTVSDMLLPFYMVLESIGFRRKKDMLITEMGY